MPEPTPPETLYAFTNLDLFDAVWDWVACNYPGDLPEHITIGTLNGAEIRLPVPAALRTAGPLRPPRRTGPRVSGADRDLLKALGEDCLTGEDLAERLGLEYSGSFKQRLAKLVHLGALENRRPGYARGPNAPGESTGSGTG